MYIIYHIEEYLWSILQCVHVYYIYIYACLFENIREIYLNEHEGRMKFCTQTWMLIQSFWAKFAFESTVGVMVAGAAAFCSSCMYNVYTAPYTSINAMCHSPAVVGMQPHPWAKVFQTQHDAHPACACACKQFVHIMKSVTANCNRM